VSWCAGDVLVLSCPEDVVDAARHSFVIFSHCDSKHQI
jgi:hypothetical protein